LTGRIREIGPEYRGGVDAKKGDPVATLVSLTLTPLKLEKINKVHLEREQVEVEGYAILFESGVAVKLPGDFSRNAALAILDVAGAPAQTLTLVKKGMNVGIIGTGKSGLLCAAMARKIMGKDGRITGIARREESAVPLKEWGYIDDYLVASAHDPVEVFERVHEKTSGRLFDLVLNTTNTPNTEMATILSTRDGGTAYFFNMATSFTAAALGAEGIGKDVTLLIGNGYLPDHAKISLDLVRGDKILKRYFEEKYS
ncbi:MAG: L-erythro-3,5-diaminohexanoate dehydrogenase, partial [Deltaproteobacteria bacterium]|nr:L-erythro-3,5-diaminohexanoate dehydrogenase [Deltaproteobacteria bacterium]